MKGFADNRSPLAKALAGKVAFKRIRAETGRLAELDLAVRSLPQGEIAAALRAALKYLVEECGWSEELLFTELGEDVHDTESQVQVLARCLVVPPATGETGTSTPASCQPFANSADELRTFLEPDEVGFLFREFSRFQEERSPISRARSDEEVVAFVDALGKGMIPISRLRSCDNASLLDIASELAERLTTSTKPSSSDTSPSSAPSETSSPASDSTTQTTETPSTSETGTEGMTLEVEPSSPR